MDFIVNCNCSQTIVKGQNYTNCSKDCSQQSKQLRNTTEYRRDWVGVLNDTI